MNWSTVERWTKFHVIFPDGWEEEMIFSGVLGKGDSIINFYPTPGKDCVMFTEPIKDPPLCRLLPVEDFGKTWDAYEVL